MRITKTCIVLLIFALSTNAWGQDSTTLDIPVNEKFDLNIQLKSGSSFLCTNTYEETMTQIFMGTPLEGTQRIINSLQLNVIETQDHQTTIEATFLRIQIENSQNVTPFAYDSEDGENNLLAALDMLIGKSFSITLNPQGAVIEIDGLDALFTALPQHEILTTFGQSYMESMLTNTFFIFNNQPVDIGEAWSNSARLTLSKDLTMPLTSTYTLESLSEDLIWLNIQSEIHGKPGLTGQLQGNYEVDRYTGLVSYGTTHYQLSNPTQEEGSGVKVNIEIDNTVEISKQSD